VRKNGERRIVNEELDTCWCLPKNLKWIIPNMETVIKRLSHCIKKRGVSRRRGVWVGSESNSMIAID